MTQASEAGGSVRYFQTDLATAVTHLSGALEAYTERQSRDLWVVYKPSVVHT